MFVLSRIYWLITSLRNWLYDLNVLQSISININTIVVGNLSIGGTGKSPMVIFLVNLLKNKKLVSILSRGYKRNTKGFYLLNDSIGVLESGDEPMQFFKRFGNNVIVAVCEDRVEGAKKLKKMFNPDVLILDDGYQHRSLKTTFNILLTDYNNPYYLDDLLPYGTLRESKNFSKRANCIIVTKCPNLMNKKEKYQFIQKIKPESYQKVYFASIIYGKKILSKNIEIKENEFLFLDVYLITGIQNHKDILTYIIKKFKSVIYKYFTDHYVYTTSVVQKILLEYSCFKSNSKIILTTEKDFMKLSEFSDLQNILFYISIDITIHEKKEFINQIYTYVGKS